MKRLTCKVSGGQKQFHLAQVAAITKEHTWTGSPEYVLGYWMGLAMCNLWVAWAWASMQTIIAVLENVLWVEVLLHPLPRKEVRVICTQDICAVSHQQLSSTIE